MGTAADEAPDAAHSYFVETVVTFSVTYLSENEHSKGTVWH